MYCKTCQYPLWNIAQRQCPECGSAFKPSDYEFAPDNVKYLCPYCNQQYFGTTREGHLEPRSFDCVLCRRAIDMDEMLLMPREGVAEHATQAEHLPWVDESIPRTIRFFRMLGWSLTMPTKVGQRLRQEGTPGGAFWYAVLVTGCTAVVGMLPFVGFAVLMPMLAVGGGGNTGGILSLLVGAGLILVVGCVMVPIGVLLKLLFVSGLWHLVLRISGTTEGGYGRTFQCACYASTPDVLQAIPCLGVYAGPVSFIWSTISGTLMLREAQKVSTTRAVFATLTPLILVLAVVGVLIAGFITSMNAAMQRAKMTTGGTFAGPTASTPFTATADVTADRIRDAMRMYAAVRQTPPEHGLQLMPEGMLSASSFIVSQFRAGVGEHPVMGQPLQLYDTLSPKEIDDRVRAWTASQPGRIVAHRVGDVVFTYHGLDKLPGESVPADASDPASMMWLALVEERSWTSQTSPVAYHAVLGSEVVRISAENMAAALIEQNEVRASLNLPPLPAPSVVTGNVPALAPSESGASPASP